MFVLVTSMRRIKGTDRNQALSKATFAANKTGSEQRSCAADPVQRAVTCGHLKLAMGADTEPRGWRLSKTQRTAICSGQPNPLIMPRILKYLPQSVFYPPPYNPSTPDPLPPPPQSTHLTCNRLLVYFQILHRSCALRLSLLTLLEFSSVHKFVSGYLLSDKHTHTHTHGGGGGVQRSTVISSSQWNPSKYADCNRSTCGYVKLSNDDKNISNCSLIPVYTC